MQIGEPGLDAQDVMDEPWGNAKTILLFSLRPRPACTTLRAMKNIVVEALRAQLKVLDEEYQQNRKALLDAIRQHDGELASGAKELSSLSRSTGVLGSNIRSISDAIGQAIANIPGEFTVGVMREYIKQHFPHIYQGTNPRSVGARLWEACEEGHIELVSPGRGGKPNIYARKTKVS